MLDFFSKKIYIKKLHRNSFSWLASLDTSSKLLLINNTLQVTPEIKSSRLKRFTVPLEELGEWESAKLWQHVGQAIVNEDQVAATEEKTKLEVAQRQALADRKEAGEEWVTKLFEHEGVQFDIEGTATEVPKYTYKNADIRPWDTRNDLYQYEHNYVVCTKTRHKTPMIRTQSIVSVLDGEKVSVSQ